MDSSARPGGQYPGAPRWVKVFAIVTVAVLLVVLFVAVGSALGLHHVPAGGHGG